MNTAAHDGALAQETVLELGDVAKHYAGGLQALRYPANLRASFPQDV